MNRKIGLLATIVFSLICFSAAVLAQSTTGEIQGTVKDQQGGVVVGGVTSAWTGWQGK